MVDPISLRIRSNEVNARARRLLRRLDEEATLQRQIKTKASRAYLAVSEMRAAAEPRLQKMSSYARDRLTQELKAIESQLLELSKRGV